MEMEYRIHEGPPPNFKSIRRVPTRCEHMLPLSLMLRYQCIVVGTARDALTLAISDERQGQPIETLERLMGCAIFTVLVDSVRMRLLLARLERREQQKQGKVVGRPYYVHTLQLHAYLNFILTYGQRA
jgi:hypothetical protein